MQYTVVGPTWLLYITLVGGLFSSTLKTEAENTSETFVTITLARLQSITSYKTPLILRNLLHLCEAIVTSAADCCKVSSCI
jgi:hypothetical protein